MATPPPKPKLSDLDKEDRVTLSAALDFTDGSLPPSNDLKPYMNVPSPKQEDIETPALAQNWAEQELIKATPRAVQEVIYQMKSGEKKERLTAALQILDRAGVQARGNNSINAPVIVLTEKVIQNIPWAKKQVAAPKVIEGQVLNVSKKDSP